MIQPKLKLCQGPCNKLKHIWKNVDGKRYCKECSSLLELPKSGKSKPSSRQSPISPRSSKQAKKEAAYAVLNKQYLKDHPNCEFHLPGCLLRASEVHHGAGRGEYLLDTTTWKSGCRPCHKWVEEHPEEAKELGFSESRLETKTKIIMDVLTQEELERLSPGIFKVGSGLVEHPWFNDAKILFNKEGKIWMPQEGKHGPDEGYKYIRVNWVAVRGGIADWAIYHSLDGNLEPSDYLDGVTHLEAGNERIAASGAKLHDEIKIQEFVPNMCMGSYRH